MKDLVKTAESVKKLTGDLTAEELADVLLIATGKQQMRSVFLAIGRVMGVCNAQKAVI